MLVPTHANAGGEGRVSRLQVAARMLADFIGGRIGTGSRYQQRREIGVAADNLRDDKINRTHANVDEQTDVVQRHSHQGQFFVVFAQRPHVGPRGSIRHVDDNSLLSAGSADVRGPHQGRRHDVRKREKIVDGEM